MDDKIVNIHFNVWASDEEEGEKISKALGQLVDWYGQKGVKITAAKLMEGIQKWNGNPIIRQGLMKYLK